MSGVNPAQPLHFTTLCCVGTSPALLNSVPADAPEKTTGVGGTEWVKWCELCFMCFILESETVHSTLMPLSQTYMQTSLSGTAHYLYRYSGCI